MPRRGKIHRRVPKPDPVYNDLIVAKFINNLMTRGKKTVAESIFYGLESVLESYYKTDHLCIIKRLGTSNRVPTYIRDGYCLIGNTW